MNTREKCHIFFNKCAQNRQMHTFTGAPPRSAATAAMLDPLQVCYDRAAARWWAAASLCFRLHPSRFQPHSAFQITAARLVWALFPSPTWWQIRGQYGPRQLPDSRRASGWKRQPSCQGGAAATSSQTSMLHYNYSYVQERKTKIVLRFQGTDPLTWHPSPHCVE